MYTKQAIQTSSDDKKYRDKKRNESSNFQGFPSVKAHEPIYLYNERIVEWNLLHY